MDDTNLNVTKTIYCKEKLAAIQCKNKNFLAANNLYTEFADMYIDLNKRVYQFTSRKFVLLAVISGLLSRYPGLNLDDYLLEIRDRNPSFIQSTEDNIACILIDTIRHQNVSLLKKIKLK